MIYTREFLIVFSLSLLIDTCVSVCVPSAKQCGCPQIKPLVSQPKIVGGFTARNHSWPWMVSLRRLKTNAAATSPGSAFCGGTLINDKYVLTAGHCFSGIKSSQLPSYFVVVGAIYRNDTNSNRYTIKFVTIHENYNDKTYENDIALLELTSKVNLNDTNIGFICLPPNNILTYPNASMNGTAIGWGYLEQGGISSYTLQQVQLPVVPYTSEYCSSNAENDLLQFCAGFIEGGKDTCQGDSGGPFMIYDSNNDTWNIAGITSYGYGCAVPEYPGVYTRVSAYVNWINAHVNGQYSSSQGSNKIISKKFLLFLFCLILFF